MSQQLSLESFENEPWFPCGIAQSLDPAASQVPEGFEAWRLHTKFGSHLFFWPTGDIESIASALRLLSKDIEKSAVGEFEYDPQTIESEATRYGAYGGHHMGTTRMGSNPRNSVVDSNCKIHSTTNLYVAGSSVFPTSSQATPTLTIVAMSLRLSNHLANKLSHTS